MLHGVPNKQNWNEWVEATTVGTETVALLKEAALFFDDVRGTDSMPCGGS